MHIESNVKQSEVGSTHSLAYCSINETNPKAHFVFEIQKLINKFAFSLFDFEYLAGCNAHTHTQKERSGRTKLLRYAGCRGYFSTYESCVDVRKEEKIIHLKDR